MVEGVVVASTAGAATAVAVMAVLMPSTPSLSLHLSPSSLSLRSLLLLTRLRLKDNCWAGTLIRQLVLLNIFNSSSVLRQCLHVVRYFFHRHRSFLFGHWRALLSSRGYGDSCAVVGRLSLRPWAVVRWA